MRLPSRRDIREGVSKYGGFDTYKLASPAQSIHPLFSDGSETRKDWGVLCSNPFG